MANSFILYFILYAIIQSVLIYKNHNKHIQWSAWSTIYRVWLVLLDGLILGIVPFQNRWYLWNSYPIWLFFSIVFYYIARHCLRNQYQYQYIVLLFHPETHVYYLGHYYRGFMYSICDFLLKLFVVYSCLSLHYFLGLLFLLVMSSMDTWFYYHNISDNTSETFHKIVGYIFHLINRPQS